MAVALNNIGRILNQVPGITGVQSGGTALINLPVNARYHRISFFCTNGGVAVNPASLLGGVKLLVNGTNMRDILPANVIGVAQTVGYNPALGELPIWFTSPARNLLGPNDANSWDLFGQSTFSIQLPINAAIGGVATTPGITGIMEFDYLRNTRDDGKGNQVPFLQPVSQHQFTFNANAGRNDIVNLPMDFPISRLFVTSANRTITLLEVYQDGNKIVEGIPSSQVNPILAPYGFLLGGGNPFEAAAVFDIDQRWWKGLKVANSLNVRVTLSAADNITIIQELLPGAYQS